MVTPQILILLHDADGDLRHQDEGRFDGYLIELLMNEWKAMGCATQVMHGIRQQVRADLVIPHLNLTVIPQDYRDFLRAYPNVINRDVVDISKSRISTHLVRRNDPYTGPVIIKTDRNHGGVPEQRLFAAPRLGHGKWAGVARRVLGRGKLAGLARRLLAALERRDAQGVLWRSVQSLDPDAYPVLPSLRDVPKGVFENKNLVVEKFLPEIREGDYCQRYYYFLGAAGINVLFRSREKEGVAALTSHSVEEVPIPDELYAIRDKLGFDYGKFDYVLRDGRVVLFDVNRTPATAALRKWGLTDEVARRLAGGIKSKLAIQGSDGVPPSPSETRIFRTASSSGTSS